jgi:dTDP-4-dehydrorhamnose reductase
VTAWSLLGSFDWNRMVTRVAGHYEPGVFDVRGGQPRPTLMAAVLRDLAAGREPQAPALEVPGWWRRESRFLDAEPVRDCFARRGRDGAAPLLIVGDDGPLTHLAVRACEVRGLPYMHCGHELKAALEQLRPWAVLDARDREGLAGPRRRSALPHGARTSVGRLCADAGVPCALFTSAFGPGLAAEGLSLPGVLVARTGPVYVPWDAGAAEVRLLDALDRGERVQAHGGAWHGVYGPDLLDGVLDLLLDRMSGGFNFFPAEGWSQAQWAREMAVLAERDPALVEEWPPGAASQPYPGGQAVSFLPPGESTLERFVREARLARREGELAVHRREDEARLEDAAH